MGEMVQARRRKASIRLLLGGLHLLRKEPEEIRNTVAWLADLKAEMVLPAHCTGDKATEVFLATNGKQ